MSTDESNVNILVLELDYDNQTKIIPFNIEYVVLNTILQALIVWA